MLSDQEEFGGTGLSGAGAPAPLHASAGVALECKRASAGGFGHFISGAAAALAATVAFLGGACTAGGDDGMLALEGADERRGEMLRARLRAAGDCAVQPGRLGAGGSPCSDWGGGYGDEGNDVVGPPCSDGGECGFARGDIRGGSPESVGLRNAGVREPERTSADHRVSSSKLRVGRMEVSGRLPREVVHRTLRNNYGRVEMCYEKGLARNPNLEGRVTVRFIIGNDGKVSNVSNGGSDLPDAEVVTCVMHAYSRVSFPQPEGGVVTVVYPISFTRGG